MEAGFQLALDSAPFLLKGAYYTVILSLGGMFFGLLLGFGLVAIFIWFAENLGTFARAWAYPGQETGWEMVSLAKLGSWFLLMIVSVVLVSLVHRPEPEPPTPRG